MDTWLIWNLTQGRVHATDYTNASRTMLFNINTGEWDGWLCELFSIPPAMLPEVRPSSGNFGRTSNDILPGDIPLTGVAGDQQAALFGQCCFAPGEAKSTFGTGCFMLMNIGTEPALSHHGLSLIHICSSLPSTRDKPEAIRRGRCALVKRNASRAR